MSPSATASHSTSRTWPSPCSTRTRAPKAAQLLESFAGSRYFDQQPPMRSEAGDRPAAARGRTAPRRRHPARLRPRPAQRPPARGRLPARRRDAVPRRDGARLCRRHRHVLRTGLRRAARWQGGSPYPVPGRAAVSLQSGIPQRRRDHARLHHDPPDLIPAMLTALGVVREREIGSISNLHASPATVGEFLLGKQAPYVAVGFVSFLLLDVAGRHPVRGDRERLVRGPGAGSGFSTYSRQRARPRGLDLRHVPRSRRSSGPPSSSRSRPSISPATCIRRPR